MNSSQKYFARNRFAAAAVSVMCCLALLASVVWLCFGGKTAAVDRAYAEATPFRAYTSLSVDTGDGENAYNSIYAGVTTADGVKRNIVVKGTVGTSTYTLLPDEYDIVVAGNVVYGDSVIPTTGVENEQVNIGVRAGNAVAYILLGVEAAPETTGELTVTAPASMTDDHTAISVANILTVKVGETELRSDMFTVTGFVINGKTASVTVKYGDITKTVTVNSVTPAPIIGADVRVKSDYKLDGLYYKDDSGADAFIKGAYADEVFEKLEITAVYANSRKPVTLVFNENHVATGDTNTDGIKASTNISGQLTDDSQSISVNLIKNGTTCQSEILNINFVEQQVVSIRVYQDRFDGILASKYNTSPNKLMSYSVLDMTDFITGNIDTSPFVVVMNTGVERAPIRGQISFDGNPAPNAEIIKSFIDAGSPTNYIYDKTIGVKYSGSDISSSVTVKSITYADDIDSIGIVRNPDVDKTEQVMHTPFSFNDFTVTIQYESGFDTMIPLKDFVGEGVSYVTATVTNNPVPDGVKSGYIYKDTTAVRIALNYGGKTASLTVSLANNRLSIVKDSVAVPALDVSDIDYEEGCFKQFTTELVYGAESVGDKFGMGLSVLTAAGSDAVSEGLAEIDGDKVLFKSGGTFRIKVSLTDKSDEYMFYSTIINDKISVAENSVEYTVTVNKGVLALNVSETLGADKDAIFYGDNAADYLTLSGGIGGRTYKLVNTTGEVNDGELAVEYKLYFANDENVYNPDWTYDDMPAQGALDAGTYTVYAVTKETKAYRSSKLRTGVAVEIEPKLLEFSTVNKYTYMRGPSGAVVRTASDFIAANNFAYADTAADVLTVRDADGNTSWAHAGTYEVTIAINDAYKTNYTFGSGDDGGAITSIEKDFVIESLELAIAAWANNIEYGSTSVSTGTSNTSSAQTSQYAEISSVQFYKADDFNTVSGEPTGDAIDVSASPTDEWAVGSYVAYYITTRDGNADGYGENTTAAPVDYNLPTAFATFEVTPKSVDKVAIKQGGTPWSDDGVYPLVLGTYGTAIADSVIENYTSDAAPDGAPVLTVTVEGTANDGTADKVLSDLSCDASGNIVLDAAGVYSVTVALNKNYVWRGESDPDAKQADVIAFAKIEKQYVFAFELDDGNGADGKAATVYNGAEQDVYLKFSVGGKAVGYTADIVEITSVKGVKYAADGLNLASDKIDNVAGKISVMFAGDYTVAYDLIDKYDYKFDVYADTSLTYTVNRAAFKVTWDYDDSNPYPFDEGKAQKTPEPTVAVDAACDNGDDGILSVAKTVLYTDAACTVPVAGNEIRTAGTFYIKVTAIAGTAALNYCYATDDGALLSDISVKFRIESQGLNLPTLFNVNNYPDAVIDADGKAITVVYKGSAYDFAEFVSNLADYEIDGAVKRAVISSVELKNVKYDGDDIAHYTVTVKPADNYKWKDGQGVADDETVEYKFTVNRKKLTVIWSNGGTDGNFVYSENNSAGYNPTAVLSGVCAGDEKAVVPAVTDTVKGGAAVEKVTDAGEYTASAALDGDAKANYEFDAAAVTSCDFTVKRQVLTLTLKDGSTDGALEFDGSEQTVEYAWDKLSGMVSAENAKGENSFDGVNKTVSADTYGFDVATGVFSFTHAGSYAVDLALDNGNYCWAESEQLPSASVSAKHLSYTVNRKTVTAPALGSERAIQWQDGAKLTPSCLDGTVIADGLTVCYTLAYGTYDHTSGVYGKPAGELSDTTVRGSVYYVLLTIKSEGTSGGDPFDYVWEKNEADETGSAMSFFPEYSVPDDEYGKAEYDNDGVRMYIHYVISGQQLKLDVTVNDYVFGANGIEKSVEAVYSVATYDPDGAANFITIVDSESEVLSESTRNIFRNEAHTVTYSFAAADGAAELVNGLPWAAGTYTVTVRITFTGAGTNYSELTFTGLELTVAPRAVEVGWAADNVTDDAGSRYELAFCNDGQTRNAVITNMPKKDADDDTAAPELTTDKFTDAGTHTVRVTGIAGDGKANFTVTGGKDITSTLVIVPHKVNITTAAASHVYGDALANGELSYDISGNENVYDVADFITLQVQDGTGADMFATANNRATVGGSYRTVPLLSGDGSANYELVYAPSDLASFTVIKRNIAVTVKSSDGGSLATSKYGDDIMIANGELASDIYDVASDNGTGDALADAVKDVLVFSTDATSASPISTDTVKYYVSCVLTAAASVNYDLTFASDTYEYVIAPATISGVTAAAYVGVYDAAEHALFVFEAADGATKNGQALSYHYKKKTDAEYKPFTAQTVRNVYDQACGAYDLKVTADNHEDLYLDGEYTVGVSQKTLDVAVDIAVFFGEEAAYGKNYMNTLSDLRNEDNKNIFTVSGFAGADGGIAERDMFYDAADYADFYGLTFDPTWGAATLNGETYAVGSGIGEYALGFVFEPSATSDYALVLTAKFTVKALPVTVALKDYGAVYNQENPRQVALSAADITTSAKSAYDGVTPITIFGSDNTDNIVTLSTDALTDRSGSGRTTNAAGAYDIVPTAVSADYSITYVNERGDRVVKAVYVISPAALTDVKPLAGYNAAYDAVVHSLLLSEGKEVVNSADENTVSVSSLAATADGTNITVYFVVGETAPDDWDGVTDTAVPAKADTGEYRVHYLITAANHDSVYGFADARITAAVNALVYAADRDSAYENLFASAPSSKDDADSTPEAWTYGDYNGTLGNTYYNPNGYNASGAQKTNEPALKFDDTVPTAAVYREGTDGALDTAELDGFTLAALFARVYGDKKFTAGKYRVVISADGTDNYDSISAEFRFAVGKKEIAVTPSDDSVTYGNALNAVTEGYTDNGFAYTVSGLVRYNGNIEQLGNLIDFELGTDYVAGYENGSVRAEGYSVYAKSVNGGAAEYAGDTYETDTADGNYHVTFGKGNIAVTARAISVRIENRENFFNLKSWNDSSKTYDTETVYRDQRDFGFTLVSGSFAAGDADGDVVAGTDKYTADKQRVFEFQTAALSTPVGYGFYTNNAGSYPIYAIKGAHYGSGNYDITFTGAYGGTENIPEVDTVLSGKVAGTYSIKKAKINMTIDGPYRPNGTKYENTSGDKTYDGLASIFKASANIPDSATALDFEANYYVFGSSSKLADAPANVGHYSVAFECADDNYEPASADKDYYINKRTIRITGANVTNKKGEFVSAPDGGYFNGYDYVYTAAFGNLADGEYVNLTTSVKLTMYADGAVESTFMTYTAALTGGDKYEFTARNSGKYEVTVRLADGTDGSGFLAGNYTFTSDADDPDYAFTLDILRETLTVTAQDANVEYGAPLTDGTRFDGFRYKYSVRNVLADDASDNVTRELLKAERDSGYLKLKGGKTEPDYVTDYDAAASVWNGSYELYFDADCLDAYNFNVVIVKGAISVVARNITVTVKGIDDGNDKAACVYAGQSHNHNACLAAALDANRGKFLSVSYGDGFVKPSDFAENFVIGNVTLRISDSARNADKYPVAPIWKTDASVAASAHARYSVKFVNADGDTIVNDLTSDANTRLLPKYEITPAALFIAVGRTEQGGTLSFDPKTPNTFTTAYGTDPRTPNDLVTRYSGFVGGENERTASGNHAEFKGYNIRKDRASAASEYAAWVNEAGETFDVAPVFETLDGEALAYINYSVTYITTVMEVDSLYITGRADDIVYREAIGADGNKIYNGGVSGDEHALVIAFARDGENYVYDAKGFDANAKPFAYGVSYDTTADNANALRGAPIKVGGYVATVTFVKNDFGKYNYKFADGADTENIQRDFAYSVEKQTVSLMWVLLNGTYSSDEAAVKNEVKDYRASLMTVATFNVDADPVDVGEYGCDDSGLWVNMYKTGRYTLTVRFNSAAALNYKWDTDNADMIISFTVVPKDNKVAIVGLHIDDYTYRTTPSVPDADVTSGSKSDIRYSYDTADGIEFTPDDDDDSWRVIDNDRIVGKTFNVIPNDAGWYIVRAHYKGVIVGADGETVDIEAQAFYLFRIKKAVLDMPSFYVADKDESGLTYYGGNTLTAYASYDTEAVLTDSLRVGNASAVGGGVVSTATGSTVTVINAGTYTVTFKLRNNKNYEWNEKLAPVNDCVSLTWVVNKATDNDIVWDGSDIEITYGGTYSVSARATYSESVTVMYAVNNGTAADKLAASAWSAEPKFAAGSYYIRAVCGDTNNYNGKTAYKNLTIAKKNVHAWANAEMTYGDAFDPTAFELVFDTADFVRGDTGATITGRATAKLVGNYDPARLDASDGYVLTLVTGADGYVTGLTSSNYNILAASDGKLVVHAKRITVSIGASYSIYGENIVLDNELRILGAGLASWDAETGVAVLGISLAVDADSKSDIGAYAVTCESRSNMNYDIDFRSGIHTIDELEISVQIVAEDSEYEAGQKYVGATVAHIYTVNLANNRELDKNVLQLVYNYEGVTNGGEQFSGGETGEDRPELAGRYLATVVSTNNDNYRIVGVASASFFIDKKEIDGDLLEIPHKRYTGDPLMPTIVDDYFNVGGNVIYTVLPHDGFVTAGAHTFTLRMKDFDNYKWKSVDVADRNVTFHIDKARNELIVMSPDKPAIEIEGWTYGMYDAKKNAPKAYTYYGNNRIVYEYSDAADGWYTSGVPSNGNAGTYYVRVHVAGTDNYEEFISEPVAFAIEKVVLSAPTLAIIANGEGKNDTYSGADLRAEVVGFDRRTMDIAYDGNILSTTTGIYVFARNAGDYDVILSLARPENYCWADGTRLDETGNALVGWHVARKKIEKPTDNTDRLIVNGSILSYFPNGFDPAIMKITGNRSGYGGKFTATVTLADTDNYVWADGSDGAVEYSFEIVGAHTVFIIVMSVLGGVACALAVLAAVQFVRFRKKKRSEHTEKEAA